MQLWPDQVAVLAGEVSLTYAALQALSCRFRGCCNSKALLGATEWRWCSRTAHNLSCAFSPSRASVPFWCRCTPPIPTTSSPAFCRMPACETSSACRRIATALRLCARNPGTALDHSDCKLRCAARALLGLLRRLLRCFHRGECDACHHVHERTTGRVKGAILSHRTRVANTLAGQIGYEISRQRALMCRRLCFTAEA